MGVKDWSPKLFKYLLVSGSLEDKLEDSDLLAQLASDEEEVDDMVDEMSKMGADVVFVFKQTEDAAMWDEDREKYVTRPQWKLHQVR